MRLTSLAVILSIAFGANMLAVPVEPAFAKCASQKKGKCPGTGKVHHSRSQYTPAQRQELMKQARAICKKRYGAASTVYRLDYYRWMVWCTE